jgi:polysaccharide chain length determinant protein (PEP-CTERM system associated)
MQRKLDGLLQQFTDQHPDVKGTRRIIEDLEAQKKTELAARRKAAAANPAALLNSDSISQGVKASLANAEARAASLRTRVAEYESRYAAAAGRMKQLPAIEAEYAQLNRDYDINKKNYDGLVQRRESASISEGMAAVSGVADFRLIDPPRASPKPVAPDRLVLLAVAMVVSLVAGALGSFAASQVQPAFFDANSLRDVTGLPLLGIVSRQVTHALKTRERKDMIRVSIVVGALIGLFLVGMAVVFYFQAG